MNKRVLLTGLGGSISAHFLAHIFHNTDWEIVGVDSFRHKGWTDRVNAILNTSEPEHPDGHPEWKKRLFVVTHDLTAPFSPLLIDKIGKIDYIINMLFNNFDIHIILERQLHYHL